MGHAEFNSKPLSAPFNSDYGGFAAFAYFGSLEDSGTIFEAKDSDGRIELYQDGDRIFFYYEYQGEEWQTWRDISGIDIPGEYQLGATWDVEGGEFGIIFDGKTDVSELE